MNPDASALSTAKLEVDLSPIEVGQAITVVWRGKPIFIRHRTPQDIEKAKVTPLSDLKDPYAEVMEAPADLPATDENRTKPGKENWLIMIGICTHLGCIPKGQAPTDPKGLMVAGSVSVMARSTIPRGASAAARRRGTSRFHPIGSTPTPKLRLAESAVTKAALAPEFNLSESRVQAHGPHSSASPRT
jgi:hypothetical protein